MLAATIVYVFIALRYKYIDPIVFNKSESNHSDGPCSEVITGKPMESEIKPLDGVSQLVNNKIGYSDDKKHKNNSNINVGFHEDYDA